MKTYYNTETGEVIARNNIFQARQYFKADGKKLGYKGQIKRLDKKISQDLLKLMYPTKQEQRKILYNNSNCYMQHKLNDCLF